MASEFATPKAPQAEVVTTSSTNDAARVGAYTDPALTRRNPPARTLTPTPAKKADDGDHTRVYDVDGTVDSGFAARTPPPHAPNSWKNGRDPYANDGMTGQDFFKNQS